LSTVDNFVNSFEESLVQRLTYDSIMALLFKFDISSEVNQNLVKLCANKGLLPDETEETAEVYLMRYGRNLLKKKRDTPTSIETFELKPRIVTLIKDQTYGFSVLPERGHCVQNVVEGSVADLGGIKNGDRIVEVNGKNVEESSHQEVVSMIRGLAKLVTLLVVGEKENLIDN